MSKPRPKASKKDVKDGDQVFMLVKMEKYLASVLLSLFVVCREITSG